MRGPAGAPDLPPGPARELVDLFRRLRCGRDLSGGQLAVVTGLSPSHVSEVLRGRKAPSPQAAAKIARALGATGEQARKAYQLAEQLGELNRYHRARGTQPALARPAAPPVRRRAEDRSQAPAPRRSQPSAAADGKADPADHSHSPARGAGAPRPAGCQPRSAQPTVDVFPVAIGDYADADLPDLDVEVQAGRLVDLLAPFGGRHRPWRHPACGRGADAIQRRLREWSRLIPPAAGLGELGDPAAGSSVLYWVGHGWSDGTRAALAHAGSPALVGGSGVEPQQLAQAIRARQAAAQAGRKSGDAGGWALVVLQVGHAAQIADAVMAALHGPDAPGRLLLVAVPDGAAAPVGGFTGMLANLLGDTYRAERRILLHNLAAQLERVLGPGSVHQRALAEAALIRTNPPVASWMSAPVETIRHLEDVLADLSADERSHFLVKAQGAEHGELSWFFEGRQDELAQISTWLHRARSGMLVVTGRAGAGKSALLGTVLVQSLPVLCDALARRGLIATAAPGSATPPESVFDAVIHLSGLDLVQATRRVAGAAGIGPLPSCRDREAGVASDLDFLAGQLAGRSQPFTVLADALDESVDPFDIARSLLARLATLPVVRILVGTRASTKEAPDTPASDENLLSALGTSTPDARGPCDGPDAKDADGKQTSPGRVVWVGVDQDAVGRYVTGRLRAARDYGLAGRAVPHMTEVTDQDIQRAAGAVAGRGQEFLFARLAVYEMIADPRLLTPGMAHSRDHLLHGTHLDLFGRALHRLAGHDDRYPILMRALSLARGRGVPEADGIWAAIAAALVPAPTWPLTGNSGREPGACHSPSPETTGAAGWSAAISGLLGQAAAYITVDISGDRSGPAAGSETVYRLAHRTFAEYFGQHPPAGHHSRVSLRLAASALLQAAARAAAAGPGHLSSYLGQHLSGHAAEAGMWDDLADLPWVLDLIDPNAVTTDAIRTLFGRRAVPPPIAGIIGARDTLARARSTDRPGLRQLATTIHSPRQVIGEPATGWGIAAAQMRHSTVHVQFSGHTGAVNRVRSLRLPDGRVVLASSSEDSTIRLWDPVTATPVGVPMTGHAGTVEGLCVLPAAGGRTLLASAGQDGTVRLWDPVTGQPAGPILTGHTSAILDVCMLPGPQPGRPSLLASAGQDGTLRLWDPVTGQPAGPILTGHTGPVLDVCVLPGQPSLLASAGCDGTVRLWDPVTGQPGPVLTGHTGPVYGVCVLPGRAPGQPSLLASAGSDGTVRLWDPATGQPGPVLTGHTGAVYGVCVLPGQPSLLASAGCDGTVRLWDPATGQPGPVLTGHTSGVRGVCVLPGRAPGQPSLLASAGDDGTVRLWDPAAGWLAGSVLTGHTSAVADVCVLTGPQPGQSLRLASAGADGTVRLWDPATGQPGPVLTGHTGPILDVCVLPAPGGQALLASAGADGTVRLWDPATGQPGSVLTGHTSAVADVCVLTGPQPGQSLRLASAGADGTVRLWDPATGQPAGPVLTGHTGPVLGVCVLPGRVPGQSLRLASAGADGTVRLWDPATGQPAGPVLTGHTGPVRGVCVLPGSPPGRPSQLASAGSDGTVRLWDPATGQPGPVLTGHTSAVLGVCVLPGRAPGQPSLLASAGDDGTVRLWDPATGQPGPVFTGHTGIVFGVCVLPGRSPRLASAGSDGTVRLWDAATGWAVGDPLVRSPEAVRSLAPCAAVLADCVTAHGDGRVRGWTAATATSRIVTFPTSPREVSAIATLITAEHLGLLTGDAYGWVHLIDLRTGHQLGPPVRASEQAVITLCPLPGRPPVTRFAAAGSCGTITIVTVSAAGRLESGPTLRGPASPIRALCPITCHDGRVLLAAAGNAATIWVWDLTTTDASAPKARVTVARATGPLTGHDGWIWSLAAIPAQPGQPPRLASAGADQTIRLWDPLSGHTLGQPLTGHTGQVRAIITASSDDGHMVLVSGAHDGTIRLWDPLTGTPGTVIPLGIPVHALLQQSPSPAARERTSGGATLIAGLPTGILALDLHHDLFQITRSRTLPAPAAP